QVGGCSAAFVSKDGLLVTNHHCGFGAVSQLSSVEHNWLRDGFAAAGRTDELPAPGMFAQVLLRIDDVTAAVHAAQAQAKTDVERWDATAQVTARLVKEAEAKQPGTVCTVASFLEGQEYQLQQFAKFTDLRLVYVPPRAIGEFGGEVDNWEWPRHTGDFSCFRVYGTPDGQPRALHQDNVPYHPAHFLAVCSTGVQDGDLAVIMGYPGLTQRYRTSRSVATRQGFVYPRRQALLTAVIAVFERAAKTSEAKALQYANVIKSLANVEKNARGMVAGLQRNAVVERKLREEEQFTAWVAADATRAAKWGKALPELLALDLAETAAISRDFALGFTLSLLTGNAPLLATLIDACQTAQGPGDGRLPAQLLQRLSDEHLGSDLELVQQPLLAIVLGDLRGLPQDQQLQGTEALGQADAADEVVQHLFERSRMQDATARRDLFALGREALLHSDDPLVVLALGLGRERAAAQQRARQRQGRMLEVGRTFLQAQQEWRGKDFYPDANGTLRVSFATKKGYAPRDGVVYTPHTTVGGLLAKETGVEPFANPPALLAAARQRQQSRFADALLHDVPVCFLCDGDTTGGNSGSPVIDGKGRLIGLNFDRVFENVAGDFGWDAERSRNIVVDVRYLLWVIESVFPSPALLRELGV
ncbi:MAG TPA: S46 family peptidase, partial [Planctomycetota bacterium]|nr:S46 family peptidase [Planctomycetota bacterium]